MSLTLMIGIGCVVWHLIFGDPFRTDGHHGWIPVLGFICGVLGAAGAP